MNEDEFAELAAGYALDALSPEDLAAFETARAQHPEWDPLLSRDAATAVLLAESVAPVAPPAGARDALLARIASTPRDGAGAAPAFAASAPVIAEPAPAIAEPAPAIAEPAPAIAEPAPAIAAAEPIVPETEPEPVVETELAPIVAEGESGDDEPVTPGTDPAPTTTTIQAISRRNWTRGMFGLAASLILLVALGFGAVTLGQIMNRPAAVIALEQIESAPDAQTAAAEATDGGSATAHWSESVGKVVLVSDGLPSIDRDQSYELWFIRDDTPVPAGTFDDSANATVLLDGTVKPGDVIAVTVEQQGGSPTGQPTTDPIITIPTT